MRKIRKQSGIYTFKQLQKFNNIYLGGYSKAVQINC